MALQKELTFDQLVGNALGKELLAAAGKELVPDGRDLLDGVGRGGAQDGGREPRKLHSVAMSAKSRDGREKVELMEIGDERGTQLMLGGEG